MSDELKPCPFCGGEMAEAIGVGGLKFFCCKNYGNCGAIISFDQKFANKRPDLAREFFNTRKPLEKIEEQNDMLRKMISELDKMHESKEDKH